MTDERILKLLINKDEKALYKLSGKYDKLLSYIISNIVGNRPEDVEEVPERLIEPRYYLIGEDLICIYKYYNKLYCAELA